MVADGILVVHLYGKGAHCFFPPPFRLCNSRFFKNPVRNPGEILIMVLRLHTFQSVDQGAGPPIDHPVLFAVQ